MKSAMITVDRNLASSPYFGGSATAGEHDRRMMPKLLMQIHDELIYEVPGNIGNRFSLTVIAVINFFCINMLFCL